MKKAVDESVEPEKATKSSAEHEEKKEKLEKALDDASKPVKEESKETSEENTENSEEKTENSEKNIETPKPPNGVKKEDDSKDAKSRGDSLVSGSEEKSEEETSENASSSKGETPKKLTKVKPEKIKKSPQKVELDDEEDEEDDADFQVNDDGSEEESGDEDSEEEEDDEENWEDMDEADKNSALMLNKFIQESSSVEQPGHDSGTTATVALLVNKKLFVANAGDSRCVVSRKGGKVHAMSEDHKPEDEIEMKRIHKAGGEVSEQGRINGGLNLSRAIGDHNYKKNKRWIEPE